MDFLTRPITSEKLEEKGQTRILASVSSDPTYFSNSAGKLVSTPEGITSGTIDLSGSVVSITTPKIYVKVEFEKDSFEVEATRIINDEIDDILNDLQIETEVKTKLGEILFSDLPIKKKRIEVRKLKDLDKKFEKLFLKLLEYIEQV